MYAWIRLGLWALVFGFACFDGSRHRTIRSKGWQLYLILVIDTFLFLIRNGLFLGVCLQGLESTSTSARVLRLFYVLSSDIAESAWIFTLLAISSGFCITRAGFGEHKIVCILIPSIFLVTSIVIDIVLLFHGQDGAFDIQRPYEPQSGEETYDPETDPLTNMDEETGLVFVFATLANTMVFFMAWFYMYDTAREEWKKLDDRISSRDMSQQEGFVQPQYGQMEHGYPGSPSDFETVYDTVETEDRDKPKTVEECVSDREKLTLMHRFFAGVSIYITGSVLVFFIPLLLPGIIEAVLLIIYDLLLLGFMAALLYVFRMRETNQFILIGSEEEDTVDLPTTELGVLEN